MKLISFVLLCLTLIVNACVSTDTPTPGPTPVAILTVGINESMSDTTISEVGVIITNQMFVGTATLSSVVIGTHSNGQPIKGWGIHVPDGIWTGSMNQIFNPSFKFPVSIKADFNYIGQEISEMSPVCIDKSKLVTNSFVITGTEAFPNVNAFVEVIVHDKVWSTLDWVLADRLNKIIYGPGLPKTPVPRCTTYKPLP